MSDMFEPGPELSDHLPEDFTDRRSISPWVLVLGVLVLALFAMCLLMVALVAMRPKDDPTRGRSIIAEQPMPDGTLLMLERVTYGTAHQFDFDIKGQHGGFFGPVSHTRREVCTRQTQKDMAVVWLTRWHPATGEALDFDWWLRCAVVDEHGCEIAGTDRRRNAYDSCFGSSSSSHGGTGTFSPLSGGSYQMIVAHFALPACRHSGNTFKLRVYDTAHVKVAEFDVPDPNPSGGSYPEWEPEEFPITKSDGDVSLTFTGLTARSSEQNLTTNGITLTQTRVRLNTQFQTIQGGQATNDWSVRSFRLFDALGNESSVWDCRLCPKESAWGLQVKMWRNDKAPFDVSEVWPLPKIPVPEKQRIQYVNQTESCQGVALELVAVGGGGKVTYIGLPAGHRGGYRTSGSTYFTQGRDRKGVRYEIDLKDDRTTVESDAPHLFVRVSGLTSDQRLSLRLKDEKSTELQMGSGPQSITAGLYLWFIDLPEDATALNGELIVHKCRTFKFQVKPPEIEPAPPVRSSWSPRSHEQRTARARQAIENEERALAGSPDDAHVLNNLAWAYVMAPEELRDATRAVTLAEKAVTMRPQDRNYINTLGAVYYGAGHYDKALPTLERNADQRTDTMVCFDLYPLAMTYFKLGQTVKAKETYELAYEYHRPAETQLSSTHWQELYEFRVEAATLLLEEPPQQAFDRAGELDRKGEWEQAAALFAKGLDVYPDDHWHWYRSGALRAYLNHADEYGTHCRRMLELFGDTRDQFIAERTGKLCLLLPDAVPKDPRPEQLIDRAIGMQSNVSWFLLASAMVRYRAGEFQGALDWVQDAQAQADGDAVYCRVMIDLFRAMNQYQLGEQEAARDSLDEAIGRLNSTGPKAKDEAVNYGANWHDHLMCEVIRREAEALIRGATPP